MVKPVLIPIDVIQNRILLIRGRRVIMDYDLAALYGVTTARLNEQVRRNIERFPADFMFHLGNQEFAALMSQIATSNAGRGGRRKLPYAFTEHGAIMAASVLSSPRAVEVSVYVVRAFAAAWPERQIVQASLAQLTWYHHIALLEKLDSPAPRLWYAARTLEHGWSRNILALQIDARAHRRHGKAQTNFPATLPPADSDMAVQVFKDPYRATRRERRAKS